MTWRSKGKEDNWEKDDMKKDYTYLKKDTQVYWKKVEAFYDKN